MPFTTGWFLQQLRIIRDKKFCYSYNQERSLSALQVVSLLLFLNIFPLLLIYIVSSIRSQLTWFYFMKAYIYQFFNCSNSPLWTIDFFIFERFLHSILNHSTSHGFVEATSYTSDIRDDFSTSGILDSCLHLTMQYISSPIVLYPFFYSFNRRFVYFHC